MGYALAKTAMLRGADVTLVTGPTEIEPPMFVTTVPVVSAADMYEAVMSRKRNRTSSLNQQLWRITLRRR